MLILTSNGLSSDNIITKLKPITKYLSKAVVVTTASVGYKEKDWHIPRLTEELSSLGLTVDFFDFDNQSPEILLNYDVVEINGGNPFYLLDAMKKSNCRALLKGVADYKILIGISAGSVVLQKDINLVAQYSPEMNDNIGLTDWTGLHLTEIEILPHFSRFISRFQNFEERAKEYEAKEQRNVIRLNDGQAVFIEGNRAQTI